MQSPSYKKSSEILNDTCINILNQLSILDGKLDILKSTKNISATIIQLMEELENCNDEMKRQQILDICLLLKRRLKKHR